MKSFVLKRVAQSFFLVFLVSLLIFIGTEILPGDVAISLLGQDASPATLHALRVSLHLYDPAPMRYLSWLTDLLRGDLGVSLATGNPIAGELAARLSNTFFLAGISALIAVPLSLVMGVMAAVWPGGFFDRFINLLGLTAISLPEFLIAYLLILVFAVEMNLFPSLAVLSPGMPLASRLPAMALPAATLTLAVFAYIMRMTRTAILSNMAMPYVEMAELKGVPRLRLVLCHVVPNSLAPVIQVLSFNLSYLVAGVVLAEVIFVYPGLGQYLIDAIGKRDLPVVQASGLIFSATYIFVNMAADILNIFSNPRLRYPR
jgi:peptide/nickel transport system permease protein